MNLFDEGDIISIEARKKLWLSTSGGDSNSRPLGYEPSALTN